MMPPLTSKFVLRVRDIRDNCHLLRIVFNFYRVEVDYEVGSEISFGKEKQGGN